MLISMQSRLNKDQTVVKDLDMFVIKYCLCLTIKVSPAKACCIQQWGCQTSSKLVSCEPYKYQSVKGMFQNL